MLLMPFNGDIPLPIRSEGYLPRGGYVQGFGTSSAFGDLTERLGVPVGMWLEVQSTLVAYAYFRLYENRTEGDFFVCFLNDAVGVYADAPVKDWADFVASPSHGTWLANVYFPKGMRPRKINILVAGSKKVNREVLKARDVGFKSDAQRWKMKKAGERLKRAQLFKSLAYQRVRK
jgi:hypothetical protein